jgi:hypothetical protein
VLGQGSVSLGFVLLVSELECRWIYCCLGLANAAFGLNAADGSDDGLVDQPVAGWHWCAVVEERFVEQHHRIAKRVAHDYFELALWLAAKEFSNAIAIGHELGGEHGESRFRTCIAEWNQRN